MNRIAPVLVLAALALSACDDKASETSGDGRTAEGEVLGGTISDAMLPLDTVQSQSPPLRTEPTTEASDAAEDEASDAAEGEPAAEASPTPQSVPAAPADDEGGER